MASGSVLGAVHTLQPLIRILDNISSKTGDRETNVALCHLKFIAKAISGMNFAPYEFRDDLLKFSNIDA